MFSRKSVGPRMETSGTRALTGYSCEDFPSRTTRNALAILSDATLRRSAVDREDLKLYWKSEKRPHFSR